MNNPSNNEMSAKINSLKVNENWKKKFRLIKDYFYTDKFYLVENKYLKKMPKKEKAKINKKVLLDGTFISVVFFGVFWYLYKGMWKKAISYTLFFMGISILMHLIFALLNIKSSNLSGAYGALLAFAAPKDYYNYMVLDKNTFL